MNFTSSQVTKQDVYFILFYLQSNLYTVRKQWENETFFFFYNQVCMPQENNENNKWINGIIKIVGGDGNMWELGPRR